MADITAAAQCRDQMLHSVKSPLAIVCGGCDLVTPDKDSTSDKDDGYSINTSGSAM